MKEENQELRLKNIDEANGFTEEANQNELKSKRHKNVGYFSYYS